MGGAPGEPNVDYTVSSDNDCHIVLISTYKNTVPVTRWFIGTPDISDIGGVTTAWDLAGNPPQNIIVEVGTINGASVNILGNVDIASESTAVPPTPWSNVKLGVVGVNRVRCYANAAGQGGGLSGVVTGYTRNVVAYALRENATTVTDYVAGDYIADTFIIRNMAVGGRLHGGRLLNALTILSDFNGDINLHDVYRGSGTFAGIPATHHNGSIQVEGTGV